MVFWKENNYISAPPVSNSEILNIEKMVCAKLPQSYKSLLLKHNGGAINADEFEYFYKYEKLNGNIGVMLPLSLCNEYLGIKEYLNDPPEFFPKGLVPFADDGGGNLTCFDYRKTKENPSIVFWVHDDPEGEDVHFVANNFDDFLDMLHESEY